MTLRPYQQKAHDAAWQHLRTSVDPCLIEAATGAGKSHIIAAIAQTVHTATGKKVLCLAPSAELVTQNREKYLASGHKASMFSASAGGKDLRHPVVFGSPLTVKNRISRFADGYALVVIDEAHGITPTTKDIIEAMRAGNPNLRVLGLTATPYRLGSGYIFRQWPDSKVNSDDTCRDPYFPVLVDQITAPELIGMGYLTKPVLGSAQVDGYDTAGLQPNRQGKFDAEAVDRAYHGHGRKTAAIVGDVVAQSQDRQGVMFFAATVQHAQEIMASLPPGLSAIVTGDTPKRERAQILARFKARAVKYLVNVSVLTTGFDAPHVDVIAILRKTESVGLLQQIIGRGLRLDAGKTDCLVLDYTTNLDDHCPDGDLFAPVIKASNASGSGGSLTAACPDCGYENEFTVNIQHVEYGKDINGYCVDLAGQRIETEYGPLSGHHGRRCMGQHKIGPRGEYVRCGYFWTSKECAACGEKNDISARYCNGCKAELIDPNDRLHLDFVRSKKNPTELQTDKILSIEEREGISQKGNKTLRLDITTPWRSFSVWLTPDAKHPQALAEWSSYEAAKESGNLLTVTYRKMQDSGFYRVFRWNAPEDIDPSAQAQ
jgi:DNA repair protein RadD